MDSDILRWLLLIVAAIVLCIWYLRYLISSRSTTTLVEEATEPAPETPENEPPEDFDDKNLIIVAIGSQQHKEFSGARIIELLQSHGLVTGKFAIYHRYVQVQGESQLVFSVINGVEPGYLDEVFAESNTPSIMFFFDISKSYNPMKAFDQMLATAQDIATQLDASVLDKDFSALTEQTIAYLRETIGEAERNLLLHN